MNNDCCYVVFSDVAEIKIISTESPRTSEIREQHNSAKSPLNSEPDDISIEN
jgi:hypothetical protein